MKHELIIVPQIFSAKIMLNRFIVVINFKDVIIINNAGLTQKFENKLMRFNYPMYNNVYNSSFKKLVYNVLDVAIKWFNLLLLLCLLGTNSLL